MDRETQMERLVILQDLSLWRSQFSLDGTAEILIIEVHERDWASLRATCTARSCHPRTQRRDVTFVRLHNGTNLVWGNWILTKVFDVNRKRDGF